MPIVNIIQVKWISNCLGIFCYMESICFVLMTKGIEATKRCTFTHLRSVSIIFFSFHFLFYYLNQTFHLLFTRVQNQPLIFKLPNESFIASIYYSLYFKTFQQIFNPFKIITCHASLFLYLFNLMYSLQSLATPKTAAFPKRPRFYPQIFSYIHWSSLLESLFPFFV